MLSLYLGIWKYLEPIPLAVSDYKITFQLPKIMIFYKEILPDETVVPTAKEKGFIILFSSASQTLMSLCTYEYFHVPRSTYESPGDLLKCSF